VVVALQGQIDVMLIEEVAPELADLDIVALGRPPAGVGPGVQLAT
jgi:hypothetical protein